MDPVVESTTNSGLPQLPPILQSSVETTGNPSDGFSTSPPLALARATPFINRRIKSQPIIMSEHPQRDVGCLAVITKYKGLPRAKSRARWLVETSDMAIVASAPRKPVVASRLVPQPWHCVAWGSSTWANIPRPWIGSGRLEQPDLGDGRSAFPAHVFRRVELPAPSNNLDVVFASSMNLCRGTASRRQQPFPEPLPSSCSKVVSRP